MEVLKSPSAFDFNSTEYQYVDIHVIFQTHPKAQRYTLLGTIKTHSNVASIGGNVEPYETILKAALRVFRQETGGLILPPEKLEQTLKSAWIIMKKKIAERNAVVFIIDPGVLWDGNNRIERFAKYAETNRNTLLYQELIKVELYDLCRLAHQTNPDKEERDVDLPIVDTNNRHFTLRADLADIYQWLYENKYLHLI